MTSELPLRVLIVEDRAEDAELIVYHLHQSGFRPDWQRVDSEPAYLAHLNAGLDLILADHDLPLFDSIRALQDLQDLELDIPFIIVSGVIGEDTAVAALKRGAADYLLKDRLARLGEAVKQALQQKKLRDEKRQAEKTLREREEYFRTLIEQGSDIIAVLDGEGIVKYVSPSIEHVLGYKPEALIGQSGFRFVHPDDLEVARTALLSVERRQADAATGEYRVWHKDGRLRVLEVIATNQRDNPSVRGITLNARDVTERKQSEARYQSVVESQTDLICRYDTDFRLMFVNRAFADLYQTNPEDLIGVNLLDVISPENREGIRAHLMRLSASNPVAINEGFERMPDNTVHWLQWTDQALLDETGNIVEYQGVGHDFSELKQVEQELMRYRDHLENLVEERTAELNQNKSRVEAILNSSIDGILLAYPNRGIRQSNSAFNSLFACQPDGFFGKSLITLVATEDRDRLSALIQDVTVDQIGRHGEFRAIRKDGTFFDAQIGVGTSYVGKEESNGLVCTIHDITDLKERERLLRYHASLQENVTDAVISTDLDFHIQTWNPAAERIYGWRTEEVIGKLTNDVLQTLPLSELTRERVMRDLMENGYWTGEVKQRHRDGRILNILGSTVLFRDENGRPFGMVAVNHDITERKQIEDDLRESEAKFRLLMEGAPQAIVISEGTGIITLVNAQAEIDFGYSRDELIGQSIELLVPEGVRDRHRQHRTDYSEAPHARSMGAVSAVSVRRKDGSQFSAEIGLSYAESKTGLLVMSFIADVTERERSAAALEEQRTFLRKVIDFSPSLIFVKDYDARFILVNPLVAQMYNTSVEALIGKSDADFNPSLEEVENFRKADRQVIASGQPLFIEEPITSSTGETRWLQTTKVPIVDVDGKSKYVLGVATDITQRRLAEQALNAKIEQELEFQTYLKELQEITIELAQIDQLDNFYRQAVELGRKRLGFERMALLLYDVEQNVVSGTYGTDEHGNIVAEYHLHFDPTVPSPILMQVLEGRERFAIVEQAPLYSNLQPVASGWNAAAVLWNGEQPLGWVVADNGLLHKPASKPLLDILALYALTIGTLLGRKRIESDLAESEATLRSIMNSTSVGMALVDRDGVLLVANQLAHEYISRLYNCTLELGKTRIFDFALSNPSEAEALFQKVFTGERMSIELNRQIDDQLVALDVRFDPVTTSEGTVIGAAISFIDVTHRKQAEESLRQALEREKELSDLKSRFTSMVSHEFRTPLATLRSSTELLALYGNRMDEAKKQTHFAKIQQQVERMLVLLDETLAITKAETVGLDFNPQPLNMYDFCVNLVREFQVTTPTHHIQVSSSGTQFEGMFDPKLMQQVITNLLSNAVKYSPQSNHVKLDLVSDEAGLTISVQDEGMGMSEEDLKHLFEPFHRGRNVGTIAGTGLGLPIVRRAVEAQSGTIHAESELNRGTSFIIHLPLSHPS